MSEARYSIWFSIIVGLFVTCLITANIIAVKIVDIGGHIVPAAVIIFPLSYIVGDVLTEVYGYKLARRVIWLGFVCNLIAVIAIVAGQKLQAPVFWDGQEAYDKILGVAPRILTASFIAYLIGEFANSFVLAKMKVASKGRHLWMRTISSTLIGQGLDTIFFITIAFYGVWAGSDILTAIITQWVFKVGYEILATPLTYQAVNFIKKAEGIDVFDNDISFNPLLVTE